MSRQDEVPTAYPKPGFTPWGYDEKVSPGTELERRMSNDELVTQLEQRFKVLPEAILQDVLPGSSASWKVIRIAVGSVLLLPFPFSGSPEPYPMWMVLHSLNQGYLKVIKK